MAQWVLSVAGIAILSVLADVILPAGDTKKYIKTVIGVVVTLVLTQPIFSLAAGDITTFSADAEVQVQQQYISYVESQSQEEVDTLLSELKNAGFNNATVTFVAKTRQLVVNFAEKYSEASNLKASAAVDRAKCKYPVKFVWNNTEQL